MGRNGKAPRRSWWRNGVPAAVAVLAAAGTLVAMRPVVVYAVAFGFRIGELQPPASTKRQSQVSCHAVRRTSTASAPQSRTLLLSQMTVKQLQTMLRAQGLPVSGVKAQLVERLTSSPTSASNRGATRSQHGAVGLGSASYARQVAAEPQRSGQVALGELEALAWVPADEASREPADPKAVKSWATKRIEYWQAVERKLKAGAGDAERRLDEYLEHFPEMREKLKDFQWEGVRFGVARSGRCLIGDEMGLGKTVQSLVLAQLYSDEWPLLIVSPASVVDNWRREVEKWLPHLANEVQVLRYMKDKVDVNKLIFVVSYDLVTRQPDFRKRPDGKPYQVVIADEAHLMKNPEALRTRALISICNAARRCTLLSGTPVLNCAAETWSLMKAISEDIPSFESFAARYSQKRFVGDNIMFYGVVHADELHSLLCTFMKRRRKETDAIQKLQGKTRVVKRISRESLDTQVERRIAVMRKKLSKKNVVTQIYSLTAQAKAKAVADYVEAALDAEENLVVFAHHDKMLTAIEKRLRQASIAYVRIDGKVPPKLRAKLIARFQDFEVRVALLSITALGQGISLTAARVAIFAELFWVPGRLLQAEDRVHRPGQTESVEIHYMLAGGYPYVDDDMLNKLLSKEAVVDQIVDNVNTSNFAKLRA